MGFRCILQGARIPGIESMITAESRQRYAKSGDVHIAYQVTGNGPGTLVFVPGFVSHVEYMLEEPHLAHFFDRLGSFCQLLRFDKRGTGLSDRVGTTPTLEERMDDVRAVMDAAGIERAAVLGISEGGPMCALFAATYPERTSALVLYGAVARMAWAPDHQWGRTHEQLEILLKRVEEAWGTGTSVEVYSPSLAQKESYRKWVATFERLSASPGAVLALLRMNMEIDARHVLPTIHVPTLILHRNGDRVISVEHSRYMARQIPGAKYIELGGDDHVPWAGDVDVPLGEIAEFLTGERHAREPDRVLVTVLLTDIVGATEHVAALGDRRWGKLLMQHHALVRHQLERFRGREIDTAGDGFLASFDGPARAVRCAWAVSQAVRSLGIQIRAGLHTGECEVIGEKFGGIGVHIGARVAALAAADEVLVSSTVKDLVAGSGLRFAERGVHVLRGVPGKWQLFAVEELVP